MRPRTLFVNQTTSNYRAKTIRFCKQPSSLTLSARNRSTRKKKRAVLGATNLPPAPQPLQKVSIHAPRTGRDLKIWPVGQLTTHRLKEKIKKRASRRIETKKRASRRIETPESRFPILGTLLDFFLFVPEQYNWGGNEDRGVGSDQDTDEQR